MRLIRVRETSKDRQTDRQTGRQACTQKGKYVSRWEEDRHRQAYRHVLVLSQPLALVLVCDS